jgi:hypothetical protein
VPPHTNGGSIYTLVFKTNRYVPLRRDRTLQSVHPETQCLSGDQTQDSVRSQFSLSGTLLMLIGRWHLAFGHFAAQRSVGSRNLISVRSALTGCVRSGFSLSGTLLESTRRWHPASGRSPLSVRSHQMTFTLIK